jgi:hypothetical protein
VRARGLALLLVLALTPAYARAQVNDTASVTLSGFSGAFPTPSVADLDAGLVAAGSQLTFTITNVSKKKPQTAHIYIAASAATLGGTKPSSDVQWKLGTGATYTSLSTTNALVGVYSIPTTIGATVSASLDLQMLVHWTDPPGTYTGTSLVITMTVP